MDRRPAGVGYLRRPGARAACRIEIVVVVVDCRIERVGGSPIWKGAEGAAEPSLRNYTRFLHLLRESASEEGEPLLSPSPTAAPYPRGAAPLTS